MKYFIAPLLALLLVGYPTFSGVVRDESDLTMIAEPPPEGPSILDVVRADLEILDRLAGLTATPYLSGTLLAPGADSKVAEVARIWEDCASFATDAATILQTVQNRPDPLSASVEQLNDQVVILSQAIERLTHDAVKQWAKDYKAELTAAIGAGERLAEAQTTLEEAEKLFNERNWIGATEKLELVKRQLQLSGDEANAVRTRVEALKRKVQFWVEGERLKKLITEIWNNGRPTPEWKTLIAGLQPFVDNGAPPLASATETELFGKLRAALANLTPRYAVYQLGPFRPEGSWLQNVNRIVRASSDPSSVRIFVQTLVREALDRELPQKASAYEKFQEAIRDDGEILLGMWRVTGLGYYQFWPRGVPLDDPNPQTVLQATLKQKQKPTTPLAVRCANQYNQALGKLFRQLGERSIWQEFLGLCQSLQEELAQRGKATVDVSFDKEIKFAQEVLASWEDIEPFLRR